MSRCETSPILRASSAIGKGDMSSRLAEFHMRPIPLRALLGLKLSRGREVFRKSSRSGSPHSVTECRHAARATDQRPEPEAQPTRGCAKREPTKTADDAHRAGVR